MAHVRRLLSAALVAGAISGLAAFGVQHIMVEPLLLKAEIYEDAARRTQAEGAHASHEWQPSDGFERTAFTCLSTVLTGVGYAALLLGLAATLDVRLDLTRGAVAGVAAFACLSLAPALGLPPQLPGSAVADLQTRQLWWLGTVIATAIGLWLFIDSRLGWLRRIAGVVAVLVPHLIGAPVADGPSAVPVQLARQFAFASVASSAMFWLMVGTVSGYCAERGSA
jgi:cobalt transporter subunit CbtA